MSQGVNSIVDQTKETQNRSDLPKKTGRFVSTFEDIENKFRQRVKAYREFGINKTTSGSGFIVVDNPNPDALFELYEEISTRENLIYIIDEGLLPFLGEFSPSFVINLNHATSNDYPYNPNMLDTEKAVRLAMAHNALDNILFEGNATLELLEDRLNRLNEIADYLGEPIGKLREYIQKIADKDISYAEATFYSKKLALSLYHHFARTPEGVLTLPPSQNKYPFIDALKELFKENLQNIILYGSSTNLRRGNDYDLLVVVEDISEQLYLDLENKQRYINDSSDRDVQLIVVPKKNLQEYLSVEGMPFGTIELVYGPQLDIPIFSENIPQRVAYQANRIVRSLTSMQMAFKDPEYYIQKPHVLRGHIKLPRYLIDSYKALYGHLLPADFFDNLLDEFQTLKVDEDLTVEKVKALRNKAVHALFTIAQRVEREIHRSA